jgi:hypothetical protein
MGGNKVGAALGSAGAVTDVDATQRNPLGSEFMDENGNAYTYVKGVASLAAGDWVILNADGTVARSLNTPLGGPAGVAMAAIDATHFGWVQIDGLVGKGALGNTFQSTNIASDAAADKKPLYLSATAGRATTTQAAGQAILGAWGSGAAASNVGDAWISRPFAPGFTLASA